MPWPAAAGHVLANKQIEKETADDPREREAHTLTIVHVAPGLAPYPRKTVMDPVFWTSG
jgi:hypothetical protein